VLRPALPPITFLYLTTLVTAHPFLTINCRACAAHIKVTDRRTRRRDLCKRLFGVRSAESLSHEILLRWSKRQAEEAHQNTERGVC
jgi:hypothetical protein